MLAPCPHFQPRDASLRGRRMRCPCRSGHCAREGAFLTPQKCDGAEGERTAECQKGSAKAESDWTGGGAPQHRASEMQSARRRVRGPTKLPRRCRGQFSSLEGVERVMAGPPTPPLKAILSMRIVGCCPDLRSGICHTSDGRKLGGRRARISRQASGYHEACRMSALGHSATLRRSALRTRTAVCECQTE